MILEDIHREQIGIIEQRVERLAKTAMLDKIPKVKICEKIPPYAKASLSGKEISIHPKLLREWEKGEIDKSFIETILAHEMGHVIDLKRGINSAYLQYVLIVPLSILISIIFVGLFVLPNFGGFNLWAGIFISCLVSFLLWNLRHQQLACEFEADRNAYLIIDDKQKIIKTYTIMAERSLRLKKSGYAGALTYFLESILIPSYRERLKKLNFM